MKAKTLLPTIISTVIVLISGCSADVEPNEISSEIAIPTNTSATTTTAVSSTAATIITTTATIPANGEECDITMYASVETNIRSQPNNKSNVVKKLNVGDSVNVIFMYDNGWYEIYDEGDIYYILGDNLSSEKPHKETSATTTATTVPTIIATTMATTVPTTVTTTIQTIKDNSDEIFEYKNLIADLKSQNEQYQVEIILYQGVINEYNDMIDSLNDELTEANSQLTRVKSQRTVRIYNAGTGNFDWVADPNAVKKAEEYIDEINDLIDQYKSKIQNSQSIMNQYEKYINSNNAKIDEYNKIILSLS